MAPLVSIITINYNNKAGLLQTMQSIVGQIIPEVEYIVIDGGSTDGSVEVIKQFESSVTYWLSEKDSGIYNAMNKGIRQAKGRYLCFFNSGDLFYNNNVVAQILPMLTGEDIIYGNLLIREPHRDWVKVYPKLLKFGYFIDDSLPHSGGVFLLKDAFRENLSVYDEGLKIVSDWKWFVLGIFKYGYSYKHIDVITGIFDYSGLSAVPENFRLLTQEKTEVFMQYFPELYTEIKELLQVKKEHHRLLASKFVKIFLNLKKRLKK